MWIFSAGLYLVHFDNGELLLAAIFGFIGGCAVLLFGGILGNWVDKTHRLRGYHYLSAESFICCEVILTPFVHLV